MNFSFFCFSSNFNLHYLGLKSWFIIIIILVVTIFKATFSQHNHQWISLNCTNYGLWRGWKTKRHSHINRWISSIQWFTTNDVKKPKSSLWVSSHIRRCQRHVSTPEAQPSRQPRTLQIKHPRAWWQVYWYDLYNRNPDSALGLNRPTWPKPLRLNIINKTN